MAHLATMLPIAALVFLMLTLLPPAASAWNLSGHMLSGIIAYRVIQHKNPLIEG